MRTLKFRARNYRIFSDTGAIPITPITLLVGENSTGKSSFLAALNYVLRFQEEDQSPELNSPPFDLGSFEQIVHDGVNSNEKNFSFYLCQKIETREISSLLQTFFRNNEESDNKEARETTLEIAFEDVFGSAEVTRIHFTSNKSKAEVQLYPKFEFRFDDGDGTVRDFEGDPELPFNQVPHGQRILSLRNISFLLFRILQPWLNKKGGNEKRRQNLRDLLNSLGAALNALPNHIVAGSPIRSTPQRVYSSAESGDTPDGRAVPYHLRRTKVADKRLWTRLRAGLNSFGRSAGLFRDLNIAKLTSEKAGPFQIRLLVGKRRASIADVGYGVSQTLPIVADLIDSPGESCFLFQQPEVHLHPRAQAGLGSFFAKYAASHLESLLVVETHSDFIIDRIRMEVARGFLPHQAVSILYFEDDGDCATISPIKLDSDGDLVDPPKSYRNFFLREHAALLGVDI